LDFLLVQSCPSQRGRKSVRVLLFIIICGFILKIRLVYSIFNENSEEGPLKEGGFIGQGAIRYLLLMDQFNRSYESDSRSRRQMGICVHFPDRSNAKCTLEDRAELVERVRSGYGYAFYFY